MGTTHQLVTESRPNSRETGGLEDTKTDPPRINLQEEYREMAPRELLPLRPLSYGEKISHS